LGKFSDERSQNLLNFGYFHNTERCSSGMIVNVTFSIHIDNTALPGVGQHVKLDDNLSLWRCPTPHKAVLKIDFLKTGLQ
jgi:hypothetical protein